MRGRQSEREVSTIADLKAAQIANWWRERHSDAEVIFKTPMIQSRALEFLSGSAPAGQELLAWMEMRRELNHYRQLILYDARGKPRLSAPPNSSLANTAHDRNFQAALRARGILTTDLHIYGEAASGQRPLVTLSLWIPMGVKPGPDASAEGALLIEIDPYQFLYPLIQSWPSFSRTSETLLVRREGDEVVYLNALRHRANAELSFRLPIHGRPTLPAALGHEGVVEGEDYRYVPVLAAVRVVPGTPWFMVAKGDLEEVYAPYRRRVWMIMIVLLVSSLSAILGAGLLLRQRDTHWFREQQAADRRLNAELEQRVKDRTVQLEASNRELEAFCYSVSHDLRAPLRGIDGWSLALLEDYRDKLDEQGRRYLDRVRSDTQRMGRLIDDLLLLSRVTRGQIQQSRVDLTAIAQSVAARLQEAEPERRVEFAAQPGLTAQGDARLLEIVLSNLLDNAWKFSRGASPGTGGVRPDRRGWQARLLCPRQRGRLRHGLRAETVRRVPAHAQGIRVPGHRHRPGHRAARHSAPRRPGVGRGAGRSRRDLLLHPRGGSMNSRLILLVEDNPSDVELTRRALERRHISNALLVAEDGKEALDYLFATGAHAGRDVTDLPTLVLLDLKLPKLDGLEVLRRIRADPRTKRLPVVILTSSNEEQDLAAGYDLGANSYIRKPVDFAQFAEAIEYLGLYWLVLNEPPPKVSQS